MKQSIFAMSILLTLMTGCGNDEPGIAAPVYRTGYSPQPLDTPTTSPAFQSATPERPSHYYDEQDGVLYSYIAAVSDEDRKNGRAAGDAVTFAYLGEEEGRHVLVQVRPDGSIGSRASCKKPCRVITRADGTQIGYSEGSVIGAAFSDALSGKLQVAQYVQPAQAAPSQPPPLSTPSATPSALPKANVWSKDEQVLIDRWLELNQICRAGSEAAAIELACAERDGPVSEGLAAQGICYRRNGDAGYQVGMHRCDVDSYGLK